MRVACLGGGPAGLYFAISMKLRDPSHEVVVFERNRADDTFGWGVVLSDEALGNLAANDPVSAASIRENFAYWDDVAVEFKGERIVSGGHGFCGIGRMKLLLLLQARARELGVELRFQNDVADEQIEALSRDYDLVVASDGLNSQHPHPLRRPLQARRRRAPVQVRLARHQAEVPRRLHLHLQGDREGLALGARLPVRRRHRDLHRRVLGGDLDAYGFGEMSQEEFDRHLRARSSRTSSAARKLTRRLCDGMVARR